VRSQSEPNALKHGAFSGIALLPGEDTDTFYELYRELIDEWTPSSPTEDDAVFTIAKCMWRKNRVQRYLAGSIRAHQVDPGSKGYDPQHALAVALSLLETEPEGVASALTACPNWIRERIEAKYPHHRYATRSAWNVAVRDELTSLVRSELERAKAGGENPGVRMIQLAAIFEDGLFTNEIATEDRLDAMIDRAIKRLVQAKTMKQMLASPSLNGQAQHSKRN
jgi:hypothetical protein